MNKSKEWYNELTGEPAYSYDKGIGCVLPEPNYTEWLEKVIEAQYLIIKDILHQATRKNRAAKNKKYLEFDLDVIAEKSEKAISIFMNRGEL